MVIADRTLTVEVIAVLRYRPGVIWVGQKNPPDPVDLTVLLPFFNGVSRERAWWNRDWAVVRACRSSRRPGSRATS